MFGYPMAPYMGQDTVVGGDMRRILGYDNRILGQDPRVLGAGRLSGALAPLNAQMAKRTARIRAAQAAEAAGLAAGEEAVTNEAMAAEIIALRTALAEQRNPQAATQAAMMRANAMGGGAVVVQDQAQYAQELVLPIPATNILASATVDIILFPQADIRIERPIIPSTIAPNFVIEDITVARQTQFVGAGGVPATSFSEVAVGTRLRGDTANVGQQVIITITNLDAVNAHTLRGQINGTALVR